MSEDPKARCTCPSDSFGREQENVASTIAEKAQNLLRQKNRLSENDREEAIAICKEAGLEIPNADITIPESHLSEDKKNLTAIKKTAEEMLAEDAEAKNAVPVQIDHSAYQASLKGKSDDQLRFIIKDATEAMRAMPDGPKAGYYADEAHYAGMELSRRAKGQKENMNAKSPRQVWESMGGDKLREVLRSLGMKDAADVSYKYYPDVPPDTKLKFEDYLFDHPELANADSGIVAYKDTDENGNAKSRKEGDPCALCGSFRLAKSPNGVACPKCESEQWPNGDASKYLSQVSYSEFKAFEAGNSISLQTSFDREQLGAERYGSRR
jgi:hypothetical protein